MSEHQNAALVRKALDSLNSGDMETMNSLLADDVEWHEIGRAEARHGKAALGAAMAAGGADYKITGKLHDVVANDDHTVALIEATATRGGRTLTYRVAEIYHIKDGKVTERWAFSDDTAAINDFFGGT
jgi:ketosteroid isomerase-like protein